MMTREEAVKRFGRIDKEATRWSAFGMAYLQFINDIYDSIGSCETCKYSINSTEDYIDCTHSFLVEWDDTRGQPINKCVPKDWYCKDFEPKDK